MFGQSMLLVNSWADSSLLSLHFQGKSLDLSLPVVQATLAQRTRDSELWAGLIADHLKVKVVTGVRCYFFRKGYFLLKEQLMLKTLETCTEGSEKGRRLNCMMSQVIERSRRIRIKKRPFCLDIKRLVDSGRKVLVAQWRQEFSKY